ncbi:MAG: hypothetical protein QOG50_3561 [Actinomycetota bacterium]|nr:hypothetical protein [Actinomycetota bacterium]
MDITSYTFSLRSSPGSVSVILVLVPKRAASDVVEREPLRRVLSGVALLAAGLAIIAGAIFCIDVATRPPCEPRYVRLLDLEPVGAVISFALAGLSLVVYWRSRRGSHFKLMIGVLVVLLLCVAYVDLVAVVNVVVHYGKRYDDGCWTF